MKLTQSRGHEGMDGRFPCVDQGETETQLFLIVVRIKFWSGISILCNFEKLMTVAPCYKSPSGLVQIFTIVTATVDLKQDFLKWHWHNSECNSEPLTSIALVWAKLDNQKWKI